MATRRWRSPLRFWGPDVDADVDDELRFHLEMCAADLVARGYSLDEARAEAKRRFGDVRRVGAWLRRHDHAKLRTRARVEYMDAFLQDLKYGVRKLWQQPGFSAAVIGVLAVGIGAATAMFSAVDAALLRPLPFYRDAELMVLRPVGVPCGPCIQEGERQSQPYVADVRKMEIFSHVGAYAPGGMNLGAPDVAVRVNMATASSDFFETLGVLPALGRPFSRDEEAPGGPRVAILSHGAWQRYYGGDRATLGRDVMLNGRPYEIVGIMPSGFAFPEEAEVWIPMHMPFEWADVEPFRGWMPTVVIGRLAPGVSRERAGAQILALAQHFASPENPVTRTAAELVTPLRELLVGKRRTALLILLGATGLVLLVACANATNLLLSRATTRRAEIALRTAIGASRARILRQLLVESAVLALGGAVVGVLLAYAAFDALGVLMPPALAALAPPQLDLRVLGFSVALALATGVLFGLWPAIGATRTDAADVIKSGAAGGTGRQGLAARRVFVVAELALAMLLTVGAGLMLRSFQSLLSTDAGVDAQHAATLELALPSAVYSTAEARRDFMVRTLERLQAMPGVEAAAFINELPLRGKASISIGVKPVGGEAPAESEQWPQFLYVTPDYFRALGIPLTRGRGFRAVEGTEAPSEIIISAEMARVYWPDQDPLGKRVQMMDGELTVIGVVGNVRPVALDQPLRPQMYQLMTRVSGNVALVARGTVSPRALARRMREAVAAVDPTQAVYNVRPMEEVISGAIATRRANTILISLFGAIALALAAVGVYGVLAYAVARRTREIGIRMALGARSADVVGLVAREGALLAALGVTLGIAGAWAFRRVMESLLYGITSADPLTFVATPVVLLLASAVAILLPARRATRVNPMEAIRVD